MVYEWFSDQLATYIWRRSYGKFDKSLRDAVSRGDEWDPRDIAWKDEKEAEKATEDLFAPQVLKLMIRA